MLWDICTYFLQGYTPEISQAIRACFGGMARRNAVNVSVPMSFASDLTAQASDIRETHPALVCVNMSLPRSSVWKVPEVKSPPLSKGEWPDLRAASEERGAGSSTDPLLAKVGVGKATKTVA